MKRFDFSRYALTISAAASLLSACNAIGASSAMPQSTVPSLAASHEHRASLAYQVLHQFNRPTGGRAPVAQLTDVKGKLYGTTATGGESGYGTVYSISTAGVEKTLYSFRGGSGDGAIPNAGLVDVHGTLYGTTSFGGATYGSQCIDTNGYSGCGTVFAITRSGQERVIYSFEGGTDGSFPLSGLTDVNGTLYGTTEAGGSHVWGTVYSISATGSEKVLHNFGATGDGQDPSAGLIDVKGTLYGTTAAGGTVQCDCGTVFSITPAGVETVLHNFTGPKSDGFAPLAGLIDVNGTLYGTTRQGGDGHGTQLDCVGNGCGTVFGITTTGEESVVYSFKGSAYKDGAVPLAGLVAMNGTLYGTTAQGGDPVDACGSLNGCGTVFSVTTTGTETVLHDFTGDADGAFPKAGLLDVNGALYGTTEYARYFHHEGARGPGTVFALTP